ncbi:MAG TPA: toll/interleukin-1 receptor domain-containing protein, partial [Myxococcota bacterium]|nr:toll/interleukin-1 receptor domain-containing protein [Myxococcota bacterium]
MLFLSYRTRRAPELGPLRRALDAAGWELWRDEERVAQGERLTAAVQEGIAAANALIVWYTDDYEQSAICRWELRRAWIASGAELPVRIYLLCAPGVAAPAHFPPELIYRAEDLPSFLSALRPPSAPFGPPPALPLVLPFPRPSSPRFVGRVPELWRLHQLLSQPGSVQVRGLGGLGKSLLVVEYTNQFTAAWPGGIFWVEGDDLRMADLLGLPPGEEELRRTALRQHLLQRGPYLWILDDRAEESPDAPTANGQTLRTTRSTDRPGKSLDLEGLGEEEALGLL